jgi:predicted nucleic acid-binding protein
VTRAVVDTSVLVSAFVGDPDDDYLVALMRSSGADVLVSLDRDLLDAQIADIAVLDPAKFLHSLSEEQP